MAFGHNIKLRLLLLIFLISSVAQGKCFVQSDSDKIKEFPVIVRGVVTNYTEGAENASYGKEISFDIAVVLVLKGTIDNDKLKVRYGWVNKKEPLKNYLPNKTYTFLIRSIKNSVANLELSTCYPEFKESQVIELMKLSKYDDLLEEARKKDSK